MKLDLHELAQAKAMDAPKPTRICFIPARPHLGPPPHFQWHPWEEPLTVEQIRGRRQLLKLQLAGKQKSQVLEASA